MSTQQSSRFRKPALVTGNSVCLRNARVDDAEFILKLRTDERKAKHLSYTPSDLDKQVDWLKRYEASSDQVYFIICDMEGHRLGTVRLYDQRGDSFCWGSWILKDEAPKSSAIESALLVYQFALALGFQRSHFDVRKLNQSVWKFHERFGAVRIGETELDYLYTISKAEILASLGRYRKYLPGQVRVVYEQQMPA